MPGTSYVLVVAGSDPVGGAGLQADLKTLAAHEVYAATAVTLLTVGNTKGVREVHPLPPELIHRQLLAVLSDFGPAVIKTGAMPNRDALDRLTDTFEPFPPLALVGDPVLVTKNGERLADDSLVGGWRELLPRVTILTPSATEAGLLTGLTVRSVEDAGRAAQKLCKMGAKAVLVKGRELDQHRSQVTDVLCVNGDISHLRAGRLPTTIHGSGDMFGSALAAHLARGASLEDAIRGARRYLRGRLSTAVQRGQGLVSPNF